ncbi:MAG: iron chelate uptake ABC transporter family permease subunit [Veillonella sp.]
MLGFVGLIVPHVARLIVGVDYRYLIPTSMVFGGILIVYADTLARMMIAPGEIPVGVLMSFGCSILLVSIERGGAKMSVNSRYITVGYGKRLLENQSSSSINRK